MSLLSRRMVYAIGPDEDTLYLKENTTFCMQKTIV